MDTNDPLAPYGEPLNESFIIGEGIGRALCSDYAPEQLNAIIAGMRRAIAQEMDDYLQNPALTDAEISAAKSIIVQVASVLSEIESTDNP